MKQNNSPQLCDPGRARRFLAGQLPGPDIATFEQHLSECHSCQQLLSDLSAEHAVWGSVGDYLRDDDSDLDSIADLGDTAQPELHANRMATRQALELLTASDDPQMLGRIGPYEISGLIGSGGMGVVFKGFDRSLNRFVAIKVLAPHLATIGSARQRFARESQAAAAVVHDNVVEIYGVSEDHDPPYLVMPYVRGMSLEKRLSESGPLAVPEILRVSMQAAAGLAAAHAQGLVHRDIKPANILMPEGVDRVRITDFGLARAADDASLTRSGVIAGTPQYMSPEQARGDLVGPRSDLFSLGSVMYAMCTGRPPFRGETSYGVLRRITDSTPRPIREINSEIPEWLCRLVSRLHAKGEQHRFATAEEVRGLLQECLNHVQTSNQPLPTALRPATDLRLRMWVAAAVSFVALLAIPAVAWFQVPPLAPPPAQVLPATVGNSSTTPETMTLKTTEPGTESWRQPATISAGDTSGEDTRWEDGLGALLGDIGRQLSQLESIEAADTLPAAISPPK